MKLAWSTERFAQLTGQEVFDILDLRSRVFVVEQNCVYRDPGPADTHPQTLHIMGRDPAGTLVAYARLLGPGVDGPDPAIGRVVIDADARGKSLGHDLLRQCLNASAAHWPDLGVHLHAQTHLTRYYEHHGFQCVGDPYVEDGIDHQDMQRAAKP